MASNPLAEVFGFPADNLSEEAKRYRRSRLCPYNNRVPSCTKDKASDPLGVCSIYHKEQPVITCPVRFRQDWLVAEQAAEFFFEKNATWTSLTEVRLKDAGGRSAGNVDIILVSYDERGRVIDFGSIEIQAVYISGNVREPFKHYMSNPEGWSEVDWTQLASYYPSPDYLSSSRKRLIPQLLYKGSILREWKKKQVISVQRSFFDTLPDLPTVEKDRAEVAWYLYDLKLENGRFRLTLDDVVYTEYWAAINKISTPTPGKLNDFLKVLQKKLDSKLDSPPDNRTILDIPLQ